MGYGKQRLFCRRTGYIWTSSEGKKNPACFSTETVIVNKRRNVIKVYPVVWTANWERYFEMNHNAPSVSFSNYNRTNELKKITQI